METYPGSSKNLVTQQNSTALILNTTMIDLHSMPGQVDYLAIIGESHFIVGSTGGQVHLFSMNSQKLSKRLPTDDLSMIIHAVSPQT
jgi:hypothetical protein